MLHLRTLYDGEVTRWQIEFYECRLWQDRRCQVVGCRRTVIGESGRQCGSSDAARAEIFTVLGMEYSTFLCIVIVTSDSKD